MLYRDNEILIFDGPTAVLTLGDRRAHGYHARLQGRGQRGILFITHKLSPGSWPFPTAARSCAKNRKFIGTVDIKDTTKEELSR